LISCSSFDGADLRKSGARIDLDHEEVLPDGHRPAAQLHVDPVGVAGVVELASGQGNPGGPLIELDLLW